MKSNQLYLGTEVSFEGVHSKVVSCSKRSGGITIELLESRPTRTAWVKGARFNVMPYEVHPWGENKA